MQSEQENYVRKGLDSTQENMKMGEERDSSRRELDVWVLRMLDTTYQTSRVVRGNSKNVRWSCYISSDQGQNQVMVMGQHYARTGMGSRPSRSDCNLGHTDSPAPGLSNWDMTHHLGSRIWQNALLHKGVMTFCLQQQQTHNICKSVKTTIAHSTNDHIHHFCLLTIHSNENLPLQMVICCRAWIECSICRWFFIISNT